MAEDLQQQHSDSSSSGSSGNGNSSGNCDSSGSGAPPTPAAPVLEIVPGAGHALLTEAPLDVARLLGEFVGRLDGVRQE